VFEEMERRRLELDPRIAQLATKDGGSAKTGT
jgi:hypothetical protein